MSSIVVILVLTVLGWLVAGLLIKWLTYELTSAKYLSHTAPYASALQIALPIWTLLLMAQHPLP